MHNECVRVYIKDSCSTPGLESKNFLSDDLQVRLRLLNVGSHITQQALDHEVRGADT
jgi:hypothetical protein